MPKKAPIFFETKYVQVDENNNNYIAVDVSHAFAKITSGYYSFVLVPYTDETKEVFSDPDFKEYNDFFFKQRNHMVVDNKQTPAGSVTYQKLFDIKVDNDEDGWIALFGGDQGAGSYASIGENNLLGLHGSKIEDGIAYDTNVRDCFNSLYGYKWQLRPGNIWVNALVNRGSRPSDVTRKNGIGFRFPISKKASFAYWKDSHNEHNDNSFYDELDHLAAKNMNAAGVFSFSPEMQENTHLQNNRTVIHFDGHKYFVMYAPKLLTEMDHTRPRAEVLLYPYDPGKRWDRNLNERKMEAVMQQPREYTGLKNRQTEVLGFLYQNTGAFNHFNYVNYLFKHPVAWGIYYDIMKPDFKIQENCWGRRFLQGISFEFAPGHVIGSGADAEYKTRFDGIPDIAYEMKKDWWIDPQVEYNNQNGFYNLLYTAGYILTMAYRRGLMTDLGYFPGSSYLVNDEYKPLPTPRSGGSVGYPSSRNRGRSNQNNVGRPRNKPIVNDRPNYVDLPIPPVPVPVVQAASAPVASAPAAPVASAPAASAPGGEQKQEQELKQMSPDLTPVNRALNNLLKASKSIKNLDELDTQLKALEVATAIDEEDPDEEDPYEKYEILKVQLNEEKKFDKNTALEIFEKFEKVEKDRIDKLNQLYKILRDHPSNQAKKNGKNGKKGKNPTKGHHPICKRLNKVIKHIDENFLVHHTDRIEILESGNETKINEVTKKLTTDREKYEREEAAQEADQAAIQARSDKAAAAKAAAAQAEADKATSKAAAQAAAAKATAAKAAAQAAAQPSEGEVISEDEKHDTPTQTLKDKIIEIKEILDEVSRNDLPLDKEIERDAELIEELKQLIAENGENKEAKETLRKLTESNEVSKTSLKKRYDIIQRMEQAKKKEENKTNGKLYDLRKELEQYRAESDLNDEHVDAILIDEIIEELSSCKRASERTRKKKN